MTKKTVKWSQVATEPLTAGVKPTGRRLKREYISDPSEIDPVLLYHIRLKDHEHKERIKK